MKQFKDLGIKSITQNFIGDKIKISRLINREIVVHDYRVEQSKYDKGNGKCLHLQIEVDNSKHVVFTGSSVLMDTIQKVPKTELPFKTTIVKENEHYEFR
ncbi:MAG: hypothetical protein QM802_20090 [Agriterribacter sp.]